MIRIVVPIVYKSDTARFARIRKSSPLCSRTQLQLTYHGGPWSTRDEASTRWFVEPKSLCVSAHKRSRASLAAFESVVHVKYSTLASAVVLIDFFTSRGFFFVRA